MTLEQDPMARLLGITLAGADSRGAVTEAVVERRHLNPYRIAHGGFPYTMGCVTAMAAAARLFGTKPEVTFVSGQYLSSLAPGPARCVSELLFHDEHGCTYQTRVGPAEGPPAFLQTVTLRPAQARAPQAPAPRTIFPAGADTAPDPATGLRLPMLAPGAYCDLTQLYLLGQEGEVTLLGADLLPETSDGTGAAHCGLVYSLCDTGVGAASGFIGKIAVTVSSAVTYFRPAQSGPLTARVRCVRAGRAVTYFRTDVLDGAGGVIAAGQFCMHPKAELNSIIEQELRHEL